MTPTTCQMARAGLNLSRDDLAQIANVSRNTIADFERGSRVPHERIVAEIRSALSKQGATFLDDDGLGAGVRVLHE